MRFLADENFPLASIRHLREADHDVTSVAAEASGIPDTEVVAWAHREGRTILTFDRDYGALIYERGRAVPAGVIYFRFAPISAEEPAQRLLSLLDVPSIRFDGHLTVIERRHIRQRPQP